MLPYFTGWKSQICHLKPIYATKPFDSVIGEAPTKIDPLFYLHLAENVLVITPPGKMR